MAIAIHAAVVRGQPVHVHDTATDMLCGPISSKISAASTAAPRSMLAVPFYAPCEGRLLGVCMLHNKLGPSSRQGTRHTFSHEDGLVAHHALLLGGLAIENVLLRGEKEALSLQSAEQGAAGQEAGQEAAPSGARSRGRKLASPSMMRPPR